MRVEVDGECVTGTVEETAAGMLRVRLDADEDTAAPVVTVPAVSAVPAMPRVSESPCTICGCAHGQAHARVT